MQCRVGANDGQREPDPAVPSERPFMRGRRQPVSAAPPGSVTTRQIPMPICGRYVRRNILISALRLGLLAVALAFPDMAAARNVGSISSAVSPVAATGAVAEARSRAANFLGEPASEAVRQVVGWVTRSGDNHDLPFVIVDKVNAAVFVFDGHGQLRGTTPALLGLARGDDSVPGIGDRKLSTIRPEERTTPAGRFVASLGHDTGTQDILWVNYADAISLHRVVTSNPKEHRLQRLAMPSPLDRRISYGCINVPAQFYDTVVRPSFLGTKGIVYILPETKSLHAVFGGPPE